MRYRERGSALEIKRKEAFQRLAQIDAYRLRSSGYGLITLAGRADTTPHYVRLWLMQMADEPGTITHRQSGMPPG